MSITINPYFEVQEGKLEEFKAIWRAAGTDVQSNEPGCAFYQFAFNGNIAFCREGYDTAENTLIHINNVDAALKKVLEVSKMIRFEIHGPAEELDKMRGPLSALTIDYYVVEPTIGFRR
eukprot:CAMPEP_0184974982 /NCGR_PEP_ID=MMETSP1098-20130426/6333_1 /TAXON_ID=89044 /ORGANISM="Spumella elongata, Strain CCAP 955/1" /LENGTH=118 /DNA_ID=CAMNT_0027497657 /DNA_START=14 /DNA_END=370 /DNA_ORIENTATION=-